MSFSSDVSSASLDSSGTISTAPTDSQRESQVLVPQILVTAPQSPQPNYKTLERLLLSSVDLARSSFTRHSTFGINTPIARYLSLHARLNKFLRKHCEFDFVGDQTYGYVLEISILMRLAESALGLSHREIVGLKCEHGEKQDDRQRLEKRCNRDVEYLVFGGSDLDVGRLPWNVKGN